MFFTADSAGVNQWTIDAPTSPIAITSGGDGVFWGTTQGATADGLTYTTTARGNVRVVAGALSLDVTNTGTESIWFNIKSQTGEVFSTILTYA